MRRWLHRLLENRLRRQRQRELDDLGEAASVMAYLDDQIATIDVTILAWHAELQGAAHTRDILIARRDMLDETMKQAKAAYRSP